MSLENLSDESRDELAALAKMLAENPKTRKNFLRLTKEAKPDLPIPELEIEEMTASAVSASNRRVEELEARLRDKEALEDLEARRRKLMKKGVNEEDIEEIVSYEGLYCDIAEIGETILVKGKLELVRDEKNKRK
jgi:hypothetical protein